jgi:carboxylesterase type B
MAHATHSPVYEFDIHLTAQESPRCGSGHGVDFALCFQADDAMFSPEQRATASRDFFGQATLDPEVARVAERLRDAIVRFAATGAPGPFHGVAWPVGGQLVVSSRPHFEAWPPDGVNPKRRLVRQTVEGLG